MIDLFTALGLTAISPEETFAVFIFGCIIAVHFADSMIEFCFTFIAGFLR